MTVGIKRLHLTSIFIRSKQLNSEEEPNNSPTATIHEKTEKVKDNWFKFDRKMKVFEALILFGIIYNLGEACSWSRRTPSRGRNPKIIVTLPPVTEAVEQATEAPTEKPTTTTEQPVTKKPVVATTEEVAQATTKTTEPKAVEASTKMVDPVTRPTSVHRFVKQSAFVSSGTDDRTCPDVGGVCREDCIVPTEYNKGRFQCSSGSCCVER